MSDQWFVNLFAKKLMNGPIWYCKYNYKFLIYYFIYTEDESILLISTVNHHYLACMENGVCQLYESADFMRKVLAETQFYNQNITFLL
jgi:hypothetical protein